MTVEHEGHVDVAVEAAENPMVLSDSPEAPEIWTRVPNRADRRMAERFARKYSRSRVRRVIHRVKRQKGWI
ncbi:hypothetical protein PP577_18490 [Mycobacteroides abscessus]|nr:hypothetical protein [Mycobacteroides abscessus]MDM2431790.1 hypothetical protein [Mycobacteroides abscessus]MDM2436598.1 hypothetical protein [Mycobacteroides abscessus]